jgi:ACS family hexuronate transporter-like MFS transporter
MSNRSQVVIESSTEGRANGAWKWWLTIVLFAATVLTYLDRQTISLCGPKIRDEMNLSHEQFGDLLAAFRWAYGITHVPAGWMADRLPMRLTYGLAVILWSAAGAAAAWVRGFRPLVFTRAALGVGEGFNWPCSTRIVANAFPPNDRGLATGIFNSGAAVGSLIAPVIILPLAEHFGWRTAFFAVGSIGFLWVALWIVSTRRSGAFYGAVNVGRERSVTYRVVFFAAFILVGVGAPWLAVYHGATFSEPVTRLWASARSTWPDLETSLNSAALAILAIVVIASLAIKGTKSIAFWMLMVVALTINPCWYFLNEWIPMFMHEQYGLSDSAAGHVMIPIFVGGGLGGVISGAIIKNLTSRGRSLRAARGTTMAFCALLVVPVGFITSYNSVPLVVATIALAAFGMTSIAANYTACQQDLSFANVGVVAGVLGLSSNICSAVLNPRIGRHIDQTHSYTLIFVLLAIVPFISVAAIVGFDAIVYRRKKFAAAPTT